MAFVPDTGTPWFVAYQIKNDNGVEDSRDDMEICIVWWGEESYGPIKHAFHSDCISVLVFCCW